MEEEFFEDWFVSKVMGSLNRFKNKFDFEPVQNWRTLLKRFKNFMDINFSSRFSSNTLKVSAQTPPYHEHISNLV